MTRDEKLKCVAEVMLMAAAKIRELSETGAKDGYVSRETSLAMQVEGIAHELRALAREIKSGSPG